MKRIQGLAQYTRHLLVVIGVTAVTMSAGRPAHALSVYTPEPTACFAGRWKTSCGYMGLKQNGNYVCGTYGTYGGYVEGYVSGGCFKGQWVANGSRGYCEFTMWSNGCGFNGYWKYPNGAYGGDWGGQGCVPSLQAKWNSCYGPVTLVVDSYGCAVGQFNYSASKGCYLGEIKGTIRGNVFEGYWSNNGSWGYCKYVLTNTGCFAQGWWWDCNGKFGGAWDLDYAASGVG
jgi:hypothetical protein